MLSALMLRYIKAEVVNCKVWKALPEIAAKDESIKLLLESMNVGVDVKASLKKCSQVSWKQYQKEMQEAFVKIEK